MSKFENCCKCKDIWKIYTTSYWIIKYPGNNTNNKFEEKDFMCYECF